MFYRVTSKLNRSVHDYRCREILRTKPLDIRPSPLRILSMLCHRDLIMYLVAVKSFYRHVGEGEIVVLDDGTLTSEDRQLLSHHLGAPHFIDIKSVDTNPCPKGGCWERLLTVLKLQEQFYVVQLDSDTLTRGAVPEVLECIHSNRSFTLGGASSDSRMKFVSLNEASKIAESFPGTHVQVVSEQNLFRLRDPEHKRYVRGSAGFAGFARGRSLRQTASTFSQEMYELIGAKWNEWASEQVACNYLIANEPSAVVLPVAKYACFKSPRELRNEAFVHFIDTWRHKKGVYARESRAVIRSELH